jgi:tRNA (guanine-N7-)-methyltransferase
MNEISPHSRLHGRSKGKALRRHQAELVAEMLPRLALDLAHPFERAPLFAEPIRELRLEIGFGGGDHLAEAAQRETDIGFIGCEPFVNGVAKLLAQVEQRQLTNIRLYKGDAAEVLDWLPERSLERVYLFYPDPWPKRRQRKRRFVSEENLGRLARVMRAGAELRFATDIDDYAAWTLARLRACPHFSWPAAASSDWTLPWKDWISTKYEGKAIQAGRRPVYLTFLRK